MSKTHTAEKQTIRVSVNSWMYSRRVMVTPEQVGLQVTVPSCSHCPTCQKRVREFTETLQEKSSVLHQWKSLDDGASWLFFPRKKNQEPLDLLRETLGIRISRD